VLNADSLAIQGLVICGRSQIILDLIRRFPFVVFGVKFLSIFETPSPSIHIRNKLAVKVALRAPAIRTAFLR